VRLRVRDLERSLELYRDVLGFVVSGRAHGLAALSTPADAIGAGHELIVLEEQPDIRPRPRRPTTAGLYHVAILVPSRGDLGRLLRQVSDSGYPITGASDHAVSESVYLNDPDGNGLELYADKPRDTWPWGSDGYVQMTVEPFDHAGVLAEAGPPTPWAMPSATRIGHVHFTVSSLKDAERFYADTLGLNVTQRSLVGLLAVSAGGYHHHVNLNTWAGSSPARQPADEAGLIEWELAIPDAVARRDAEHRLEAAGCVIQRDHDVVRAADEDGNIVVLV
jgi:catechol 2,3-dioxygenase